MSEPGGWRRAFRIMLRVLFLVGVVVLWESVALASPKVRLLVGQPTGILAYIGANGSHIAAATWATLVESVLGLTVASLIAVVAGLACMRFPRFVAPISGSLLWIQVIPIVVFAPFATILFGFGLFSKVALASLIAFLPAFQGLIDGYRRVPMEINDLATAYDIPTAMRIKRILFPLALPSFFTGLKLSAPLAVLGAVVAEFTGARAGLGKNLLLTTVRIEPELMVVSASLTAAMGAGLYLAITFVQRRVVHWSR